MAIFLAQLQYNIQFSYKIVIHLNEGATRDQKEEISGKQ